MIRALIVEDELYNREALKALINSISNEIIIIGESESVKEAVHLCDTKKPDLVFLDINLKDGTGFNVLEQLDEINFKVIFITAYQEFMLKALRFGAIDYILKPIDEDELNTAIQKVMLINETQTKERISVVQEQFAGKKDRIVLSMQDCFQIVYLKDLMYCQADGGYTTFHMADNRSFIVSKPLKDYTSQLPEENFIRTHQSYLVNSDFIDHYDKSRYLFLKNGTKIAVSVRKRDNLISSIFKRF